MAGAGLTLSVKRDTGRCFRGQERLDGGLGKSGKVLCIPWDSSQAIKQGKRDEEGISIGR